MSQKFILTFKDESSYDKYKKEITDSGGTIVQDYGRIALGLAALLPESVVTFLKSASLLGSSGITSFDPDAVVTTQQQ